MRAIWKGQVAFGLVTVPVRLFSATENHDVQFRMVRKSDGSRIRFKRVAAADGEEVVREDIAKGYETADGSMVVLTDDDFKGLKTKSTKEIAVEKFVPAEQIDPILLDKSYYLEPDTAAVKPYSLLRETLRSTDRMAVVTVSLRSRVTMAVLRVYNDVIVLQTLLWPDEIRAPDFAALGDVPEATEQEVSMAQMLIESMADDFNPDDYEDDYAAAVEALVHAKLEGGEIKQPANDTADEGGEVVDLMAALQQSIHRAKEAQAKASGE